MSIGSIEMGNKRVLYFRSKAIEKLKEQRKATRAVMQRYEGASDLSVDEKTTYDHLTVSMVILNALSDQLVKSDVLPRTWDGMTFGSDFDTRLTPLLRKNDEGELWVEYFDFARPRDLMDLLAGHHAHALREEAPSCRQRPRTAQKPARESRKPASEGVSTGHEKAASFEQTLMDLVRTRMPKRTQNRYMPEHS